MVVLSTGRGAVVRSLAGDSHVVGMAFGHTGIGDAGEFCRMERFDVFGAAVAHAGTQAAEHLVDNLEE